MIDVEDLAHCGWCYPWQVVLRCIKKNKIKNLDEQQALRTKASKQHSAMASASVPASKFLLWVSALTSLSGLWAKILSQLKPFLPKSLFGHGVLSQQRNLSQRHQVSQWLSVLVTLRNKSSSPSWQGHGAADTRHGCKHNSNDDQ